jgi:hypothetical protein
MSNLFRSADMSFVHISVLREKAKPMLSALGRRPLIHLVDANPESSSGRAGGGDSKVTSAERLQKVQYHNHPIPISFSLSLPYESDPLSFHPSFFCQEMKLRIVDCVGREKILRDLGAIMTRFDVHPTHSSQELDAKNPVKGARKLRKKIPKK